MLQIEDVELSPTLDGQTQACIKLWAAVFHNGIAETVASWRNGNHSPWFDDDRDFPGSFVWLCEMFNIGVEQARSTVRMNARQIERTTRTGAKARAKAMADSVEGGMW